MSDLAHEIVKDLKRVAGDLGRTPTRDEYRGLARQPFSELMRLFKAYTVALNAAGLEQNAQSARRAPKLKAAEFFAADLAENLAENLAKPKIPRLRLPDDFKDILVIGDCHFPFVDHAALTLIYAFVEAVKPKRCVQIGDLYDQYAQSRFPRSLNVYTPDQEIELGIKMATEMWRTIQSLSPGIECHQILGNHDYRPVLRQAERNPEGERYFNWERFYQDFTFPGVSLLKDHRQELVLDGISFIHGFKSKLGDHRDHVQGNCVTGHSHRGGVLYRPMRGQITWELNAGYIGDAASKALGYTPSRITNWTPGFGYIDSLGPRFIPG